MLDPKEFFTEFFNIIVAVVVVAVYMALVFGPILKN